MMTWQSLTRSNLWVGQEEIPFSSRLNCVAESSMLNKLNTVDILVCFISAWKADCWSKNRDYFLIQKRKMQRGISDKLL